MLVTAQTIPLQLMYSPNTGMLISAVFSIIKQCRQPFPHVPMGLIILLTLNVVLASSRLGLSLSSSLSSPYSIVTHTAVEVGFF